MKQIDLAEIIDTRDEQSPLWVASPWSDTFEVLLRPQTRKQQELLEEATELEWDLATMKKVPKVDREKYLHLFGNFHIVNWRGLDLPTLKKLVPVKPQWRMRGAKGLIACDEKSRQLLLMFSSEFNGWVNQTTLNIELYNQEREEESGKK
jgi:hypothetical protein